MQTTSATPRTPIGSTPWLEALKAQPRQPGEASFFYLDTHFQKEAVKVLPGEFFVHHEDLLITTTLGSCIAACIWDREHRVGGMNHFMLPAGPEGGTLASDSGRYGAFAMELLIGELVKRGATRAGMEAKVFGGGAVIEGLDTINVGQRNTAFVLDYLRNERIAVVSKDVLGTHPRKVCYLPASGKAMVKRLASASAQPGPLAAQERLARQGAGMRAGGTGSAEIF